MEVEKDSGTLLFDEDVLTTNWQMKATSYFSAPIGPFQSEIVALKELSFSCKMYPPRNDHISPLKVVGKMMFLFHSYGSVNSQEGSHVAPNHRAWTQKKERRVGGNLIT